MKHNRNTYLKYKCRCDICVADNSRYKRERKIALGGDSTIRLDATPLLMRLIKDGSLERVSRHVRRRWIEKGIPIYRADEYCIKFGYHPANIFGMDFYQGCNEEVGAK